MDEPPLEARLPKNSDLCRPFLRKANVVNFYVSELLPTIGKFVDLKVRLMHFSDCTNLESFKQAAVEVEKLQRGTFTSPELQAPSTWYG